MTKMFKKLSALIPLMLGVLLLAVTLSSCGGGGGGGGGEGSTPAHAPAIANPLFSPVSAPQSSTPVAITGSIQYTDAGGDISSLTVVIYDSNGVQVFAHTGAVTGVAGHTSGTIYITGTMDVSVQGVFTLNLYVTDSTGASSNALNGTFTVT